MPLRGTWSYTLRVKSHDQIKGLNIAVLTVSDTAPQDNTSGQFLEDSLGLGHQLADLTSHHHLSTVHSRHGCRYGGHAVLLPAAQAFQAETRRQKCYPRQDHRGFGEVFRALVREIGSSTVQSRAIAGLANRTAIFCMPGSTAACRTAWNGLIKEQLDEEHRPCNFVKVLRGEV